MEPIRYLVTDLDRTLFPNGPQPAPSTLSSLKEWLTENQIEVIYATGRNEDQIRAGILEFDPPLPQYAIAEVGTRIFEIHPETQQFIELIEYRHHLQAQDSAWSWNQFRTALDSVAALKLQPPHNQNEFKLSYTVQPDEIPILTQTIEERLKPICLTFKIIDSVDETTQEGLIDILPLAADKQSAIEFLLKKINVSDDQIAYAGDSGNDLLPLTHGYRSILVSNATEHVRTQVIERAQERGVEDKVYLARLNGQSTGHYFDGILQGLKSFS